MNLASKLCLSAVLIINIALPLTSSIGQCLINGIDSEEQARLNGALTKIGASHDLYEIGEALGVGAGGTRRPH